MSWLLCDNCEELINTKEHPESYDERMDKWWCDRCFPDYEKDDVLGVYAK